MAALGPALAAAMPEVVVVVVAAAAAAALVVVLVLALGTDVRAAIWPRRPPAVMLKVSAA
jgi:hypothetical protein